MPAKQPDQRSAVESDDTFDSKPRSDEARIPQKGALMPEHPRDGTAEASDMHDLVRRAVESGEDPEAPLDFDPPDEAEDERTRPG